MEEQLPWIEMLKGVGYDVLMLYLTYRMFNLLSQLVSLIKDIQIQIIVKRPPPPPTAPVE